MKYNTPAYFILLSCVLLWCALIVLPLFTTPDSSATQSLFAFFSLICHQFDSHSLHVNGHTLAVCARCSSIYFGFLAAVILLPLFRAGEIKQQRVLWLIALLPMLADVVLHLAGLHESSSLTRIATGGFFGVIAGRIIVPLVTSLFPKKEKYPYSLLQGF